MLLYMTKYLKETAGCGVKLKKKRSERAPASNVGIQAADYPVFIIRELSMFNVGPEIV